jgi:hypothetical protein
MMSRAAVPAAHLLVEINRREETKELDMKLLQEANFEVKTTPDPEGKLFFEGVFVQLDLKNRNNRVYPSAKIAPVIEQYIQEQVAAGKAVGEADHPTTPNLNIDRISHKIVSLVREGSNYVGRALVLDTPMGRVLRGLIEGGVTFGVSTRAVGQVRITNEGYEEVGTPFVIVTAADAVMNPSAPDAFVQAIKEHREWVMTAEGQWIPRIIEETEKAIDKAPISQVPQVSFESYQKFIKAIGRKA